MSRIRKISKQALLKRSAALRNLYKTIESQQSHIQNLEHDLKQKQGRIYYFNNIKPAIHFITNQLDATGAPLIFMEIVKDFKKYYPDTLADLHTYTPADHQYIQEMTELGIKVQTHDQREMELVFSHKDVVVLNTAAHSVALKNSIFDALEKGKLNKLVWYMHEDWPEIFFDKAERQKIRRLIDKNKITIFLPAKKALANHRKAYAGDSSNVRLLPYRLRLPDASYIKRNKSDFEKLKFIMIGKTGEGLKGQLPILYAFLAFKKFYFDKYPKRYRDFELRFVAIEADYLSLQILRHASGLDGHFNHLPPLPHDRALSVIKDSNITICYSMRECLPIFVYEGMAAGHPILRNDASGMEEQLQDGKNGYYLESDNFYQVLDTIEAILNIHTTSDEQLSKMSAKSNEIAASLQDNSYEQIIKVAADSLID